MLADYRETVSDLLLDTFTAEWGTWARGRKRQVRNQAHGAPASLLDLYAASDIPETEGAEIQRFKWATSAAHVAGRPLVSAEAATWLGEHFRSTLADVRAAVDRFFVAGVNHIFYHGTAYSPAREPWPGWLFYAAVEFSPQNAWWDDFGTLNGYVARVQSFLQAGRPDHDVLLYYPLYESLTVRGNALLTHFGGASPPAQGTTFEEAASRLESAGFTYDFISDRQIRRTRVDGRRLVTDGGASYGIVVLPSARYIPLETFEHVLGLARSGATVVSFKGWPSDVAGFANFEERRARLKSVAGAVQFGPADADGIREAGVGRGRILRGDDVARVLTRAGVRRERMVDQGLQFARRADARGRFYFVSQHRRACGRWVGAIREHRTIDRRSSIRWTAGGETPSFAVRPEDGRCISSFRRAGRSWSPRLVHAARERFENYQRRRRGDADRRAVDPQLHQGRPDVASRALDRPSDLVDGLRRGRGQLLRHRQLHREICAPAGRRRRVADRSRPGPRERTRPVEWP